MTQQRRVLEHLKKYGSITPLEALDRYGIYRLSVQIWRLRKKGHNILTDEMEGTNRLGEPIKYGKYIYIGANHGDIQTSADVFLE